MRTRREPLRRSPCLARALTATLLGTTILLGVAAGAHAGIWALVSCSTPSGRPAPTDGWLAGGAGDDKGSTSTCSAPGGALVARVGDQAEQPAYEPATWTFTAPPGSTIAGGALKLSFYDPEGQGYAETPQSSYDAADVIGNCQYNTGTCARQWNPQTATIGPSQTGGTQIFIGAECVAPVEGHSYCQQPGDPFDSANGLDAQTDLYQAVINLQNNSTPAASGFSGALLAPGASGTADLLFTASDPNGPGILTAALSIDGKTVYDATPNLNGGRCHSFGTDSDGAPEFLYEQPCKQSLAIDIPVDTSTLAPGPHQLQVALSDAAGNAATVYSGTITTARLPHIPNGAPCAGAALTLTVNGRRTIRPVLYGHRVLIRGWLHCATTPIPGANVELAGAGRGQSPIRTDAAGRFSFRVPRGPSRTLTFSYRAYSDDQKPSAIARLRTQIRPAIKLRIAPSQTRNGDTIEWSGDVAGGPYPRAGLTLLVQVKIGRRWETFDQLVTHSGRFAYRYTFLRTTTTTTYAFRIALPVSGAAGYDYLPATSRALTVTVSP
jgi:hypothetical protein